MWISNSERTYHFLKSQGEACIWKDDTLNLITVDCPTAPSCFFVGITPIVRCPEKGIRNWLQKPTACSTLRNAWVKRYCLCTSAQAQQTREVLVTYRCKPVQLASPRLFVKPREFASHAVPMNPSHLEILPPACGAATISAILSFVRLPTTVKTTVHPSPRHAIRLRLRLRAKRSPPKVTNASSTPQPPHPSSPPSSPLPPSPHPPLIPPSPRRPLRLNPRILNRHPPPNALLAHRDTKQPSPIPDPYSQLLARAPHTIIHPLQFAFLCRQLLPAVQLVRPVDGPVAQRAQARET